MQLDRRKKIAIVTTGLLPVPASMGGAVENLVNVLLDVNEVHKRVRFSVFSSNEKVAVQQSQGYKYSDFFFIDNSTIFCKIRTLAYRVATRLTGRYYGNNFINNVARKISDEEYDLVIIENSPIYSVLIKRVAPNIKVVQHIHNENISLGARYMSEILCTTDSFFAVSNFIRNKIENTISSYGKSISSHTWYNGIDVARFKGVDELERAGLRARYGIDNDDLVCIFTGRIVPDKGIKELLEAFKLLHSDKNIKLLILGSPFFGRKSRSKFQSDIISLSEELKESVTFLGYIPYKDIHRYYAIADIATLPSIWNDPFPLTCLEAMASGLALIITNSGGMTEAVSDECAFVLNISNQLPDDLSKTILLLKNDPDKLQEMKINSRLRSERFFTIDSYYLRFIELLDINN